MPKDLKLQLPLEHYTNPATGRQEFIKPRRNAVTRTSWPLGQRPSRPRPALEPITDTSSDMFLRGVTVYMTGYMGDGMRDIELKQTIQKHGGRVVSYFTKGEVTHMLATTLCSSKMDRIIKGGLIHVVKPDWILECVSQQRRVPERSFSLISINSAKSALVKQY